MKSRRIEISEERQSEIPSELKKSHPAHVYKRLMALKMRTTLQEIFGSVKNFL